MSAIKPIYRIKVTLRNTHPPIWRRILVRDTMLLSQFHDLLQTVMGWTDSHMHQFIKGEEYFGPKDAEMDEVCDESAVKLNEILRKPKERILYEYDFGDGWHHDIVLEQVLEADPNARYPWIVAGKGACPPEDCGGVYGYYDMLRALKDPGHPDYEDLLEWLGGSFNPDEFDMDERNAKIHARRSLWRGRA